MLYGNYYKSEMSVCKYIPHMEEQYIKIGFAYILSLTDVVFALPIIIFL